MRLKSLVIAPTVPADARNGLAMRVGFFVEAFRATGDCDVLVLPVAGGGEGATALCRRLGIEPTVIDVAGRADTHFAMLKSLPESEARLRAFQAYGKPSLSAFLSVPVLAEVRRYLAERRYDRIHMARSYLMPVIAAAAPAGRPPVSVDLDEDDVETCRSIGRLRALRGDAAGGRWDEAEALAFERLIARWLPETDTLFVATARERDVLRTRHGRSPIVVPNVVDLPPAPARQPGPGSLLFVGGFGYLPNLDAALWLVETILPLVRQGSLRAATLALVGQGATAELVEKAGQAGVTLLPDVDDLAPLYARASVALVPLRAGGGSRIKLLEAAAHRVPVVATSIGAENLGLQDGHHIWVADTAERIAAACAAIWDDPGEAARRASAARSFVAAHHARTAAISTLTQRLASPVADAATMTGDRP